MKEKISLLHQKLNESKQGGGKVRNDTQHKKGKLTARERIQLLMDPSLSVGVFTNRNRFGNLSVIGYCSPTETEPELTIIK